MTSPNEMNSQLLTILIVDDEPNMRRILEATLRREGYQTLTAQNGADALNLLKTKPVQVILTDLKMPVIDGLTLLRECNTHYPGIPVIMLTAHGTVETAVEAMKIGAADFISKPFDIEELRHSLQKAAGRFLRNRDSVVQDLPLAMKSTKSDANANNDGIIALSTQMRSVLDLVKRVADSPSTILITGESGTGKELIAGMIHENSARSREPIIKVNCAAIPETLLESEFFGHERGAFTGAVTAKPGRFELADKGTLFLDEISEVSPEIQVKLLRAIQEKQFERVGGIKTLQVDVRLVAATNLDLAREVEEGRFRSDLFYRLNVIPIHLPPLRDRPEDIPPLVTYFIERMNTRLNRSVRKTSAETMKLLQDYHWPGNIRELENVIERAVLLCSGEILEPDCLNLSRHATPNNREAIAGDFNRILSGDETIHDVLQQETDRLEYSLVMNALIKTGGNVTRAAKVLGLSRKGLQLKIRRHGIDPRDLPERPDFSLT